MTMTMEKGLVFEQVKDARDYVQQGDVLNCLLTRTYEGVGIFANAFVEKDGKTVSVSGLFKDYFGKEGTHVWAKVMKFDSKGKISFAVCEEPSEATEPVDEPVESIIQPPVMSNRSEFEAELNKAKEAMRAEFELKLQEAEMKMKEQLLHDEKEHIKSQIAKITGIVSPKADSIIEDMLEKTSATAIGRALAIVSANHDASLDFVSKMQKVLWGCL